MIDGWELGKSGAGKLFGNLGHEIAAMSGDTMLILAGIFSVFLVGATATWTLHKAVRRAEKRLAERLVQEMHYELPRRQEIRLARLIAAVGVDPSEYELELTERVEDRPEKKRGREDEAMKKLMSSMRRLKGQDLKVH